MKDYLIDVPVLFLFFTRPEQTAKVFEQIKAARPSKLYLYQDGAREGREDDVIGVKKCRDIVENIDWDCEVHKHYCEKNQGCDPSEYLSQKWMFENEEYGIILEDDDVPSQSFFPFCKELLEKYKDDQRIHMICGQNILDEFSNSDADYFFSNVGSIWGWATWKRVIDGWNSMESYSLLDDEEATRMYLDNFPTKKERRAILAACHRHRASKKEYYETINSITMMMNSRLSIIPTKNMISNIGISANSTHAVDDLKKLSPKTRKLFFKKTYDYQFPLKHPKYVVCDKKYKKKIDAALGNNVGKYNIFSLMKRMYWKIKQKI